MSATLLTSQYFLFSSVSPHQLWEHVRVWLHHWCTELSDVQLQVESYAGWEPTELVAIASFPVLFGCFVSICVVKITAATNCSAWAWSGRNKFSFMLRLQAPSSSYRPGTCTAIYTTGQFGACSSTCQSDQQCPTNQKCCSNGFCFTCQATSGTPTTGEKRTISIGEHIYVREGSPCDLALGLGSYVFCSALAGRAFIHKFLKHS